MKRKRKYGTILLIMSAILLLAYSVNESYYRGLEEVAGVESEIGRVCDYHFDMIVDKSNSSFWDAVFQSARERAEEDNALLEMKGVDKDSQYDKIDYMNMCIAAQSDGIILENNGEEGLDQKINEAVQNGIPVVTVMGDASYSQRQSYVGVSDYQLGAAYAEQVSSYMRPGTQNILILTKKNMDDQNQGQIVTLINNGAQANSEGAADMIVSVQNFLPAGPFDAEEAIRDIFQQEEGPPDMLVCMDEETTECARQAVIDYNQAGKVLIIGYYTSESIVDAVSKGVISSTCSIDTEQMGEYSVQALMDYIRDGRTSSYFNVDLHFVDEEEAKVLERKMRNEKDPVE